MTRDMGIALMLMPRAWPDSMEDSEEVHEEVNGCIDAESTAPAAG